MVIQLQEYRNPPPSPHDDMDAAQNALWDELAVATAEAWSWRDHESLDRVVELTCKLRPRVEIPA